MACGFEGSEGEPLFDEAPPTPELPPGPLTVSGKMTSPESGFFYVALLPASTKISAESFCLPSNARLERPGTGGTFAFTDVAPGPVLLVAFRVVLGYTHFESATALVEASPTLAPVTLALPAKLAATVQEMEDDGPGGAADLRVTWNAPVGANTSAFRHDPRGPACNPGTLIAPMLPVAPATSYQLMAKDKERIRLVVELSNQMSMTFPDLKDD